MSLAGLGGIVAGAWVGLELTNWIDWHQNSIALRIVSFLCIFLCSFLLMSLAARLVKKVINCTAIGVVDGLLGAALSICSWGGLVAVSLSILGDMLYVGHGPVGNFLKETGSWILQKYT